MWRWYRALRAGRVLPRREIAELFMPVVQIQEGRAALGWFVGRSARGHDFIFTRGNDDFGPNSLIYAFPDSGTVIVLLTHAGMVDDDLSWSRCILGKLEDVLLL